jgi:hypothetical protein
MKTEASSHNDQRKSGPHQRRVSNLWDPEGFPVDAGCHCATASSSAIVQFSYLVAGSFQGRLA